MYDSGNTIKQSESSKQPYPSVRMAVLRVNGAHAEPVSLLIKSTVWITSTL